MSKEYNGGRKHLMQVGDVHQDPSFLTWRCPVIYQSFANTDKSAQVTTNSTGPWSWPLTSFWCRGL